MLIILILILVYLFLGKLLVSQERADSAIRKIDNYFYFIEKLRFARSEWFAWIIFVLFIFMNITVAVVLWPICFLFNNKKV